MNDSYSFVIENAKSPESDKINDNNLSKLNYTEFNNHKPYLLIFTTFSLFWFLIETQNVLVLLCVFFFVPV